MRPIKAIVRSWFTPWKIEVTRFIGTERSNCDEMVGFMKNNRVRPISYSTCQVEKRFVSTFIYKIKR